MHNSLLENIFSLKNETQFKVITILGIKIKIDTSKIRLKLYRQSQRTKSCLIISHDLSYTGAPLVLKPLISYLKNRNINVTILSIQDGPLYNDFKKENIPVFILKNIYKDSKLFINFVKKFDFVFCNTLVVYPAIDLLDRIGKTYYWWLHESQSISDLVKQLPVNNDIDKALDILKKSKNVYTVSNYANNSFVSKHTKHAKILSYGIEDFSSNFKKEEQEKLVLTMVGSVQERKGQDILINALLQLPEEYLTQIQLDIIGDNSSEYAKSLIEQTQQYNNINFKGIIHFTHKADFYSKTDVLVCISRDDPLPVVVTEAMICKIPSIISTHVGQVDYIKDFYNGFVIENENIEQLKQKIIWCLENKDKLSEIGKQARKVYDEKFSIPTFENNINKNLFVGGKNE